VLTGTRPGLEWFLFAAFPAIVVGALTAHFAGALAGVAAGLAALALLGLLGRRLIRRGSPTDRRG
jgi:hypothetical protein